VNTCDEPICRVVKENAVCWKLFLFGHFVGSESTEEHAKKRADSLTRAVEKFADAKRKADK
jgi:hypothetical protein